MKSFREHLKLYLVTDRQWNKNGILEDVEIALENGVTCLQIREKDLSHDAFVKLAKEIQIIALKRSIPLIINDNLEVALSIDAEGLHIGQDDGPVIKIREVLGYDKVLGVSVSTVDEAIQAERDGADYLGVGALFPTSTKDNANVIKKKTLKAIVDAVAIPVVAIGGINDENILSLNRTGIYGTAVVSSILSKENIKAATEIMRTKTDQLVHDEIRKVLTIAGSDCSGGAGVQADLKTIAAHKCYGMSVITALTAQNTQGVYGIESVSDSFVSNQLECVFKDIRPEAVKIGMVSSKTIIESVAYSLKRYKASHVVLDPVMVSTSGSRLLDDNSIDALKNILIPLADVITPNIPEAEILTEMTISNKEEMIQAAQKISKWYEGNILIKGGHLDEEANDLFYSKGQLKWFSSERVDNPNTHGTGCTLSTAIAANLAKGYGIERSIELSKDYITGAIKDQLDIGKGRGPLNHLFDK